MEIKNSQFPQNEQLYRIQPILLTPPAPPQTQDPPKKPLFELSKGNVAFIICALIGCVFTSLFGISSDFALGYTISLILMTVIFIFYLAKKGKGRIFPIICGLLALGCSAVFICTSNSSVRFFGVIVSFLLALTCFDGLVNGKARGNRNTIGIIYSAGSTFGNIGVTLKSIFSGNKNGKKSLGKAFIGLACSLPVLLIVVPLLLNSDDAFMGMMSQIFDNTFSTIIKITFGASVSIFAITYGLSLKHGRISKIGKSRFKGIENVYIISFLSAISFCYILYLFSQLAYFFSAFSGFLPENYDTYSEYARNGFFEMCAIAVINLGIVFAAWLLAKKKNGKMSLGIKLLCIFISLFTLVIIGSTISKMVLYISGYGMTVLRITTSAFMVFLAIVFISVILKVFIKKINFVKTSLLTASIIILLLGTLNVNAVCAKYNYENYVKGNLKDFNIEWFYDLGDEGIPYLIKLGHSDDKDIVEEADSYLLNAYKYDYFEDLYQEKTINVNKLKQHKKYDDLDSYTIPRSKAYEALYEYIEEYPGFCYLMENNHIEDSATIYY